MRSAYGHTMAQLRCTCGFRAQNGLHSRTELIQEQCRAYFWAYGDILFAAFIASIRTGDTPHFGDSGKI